MILPYVQPPDPPTVCLLTPQATVISEHGEPVDLERLPDGYRVWTSYDTAHTLVGQGVGEALCWNGEEIRWRHRRFEDGWKRRSSDVAVLRLPFDDDHPERTLAALRRWRDWLADAHASPLGTSGSAAWSLLRARLEQALWTSMGARVPLRQTLGGRQELGPAGQGRYEGRLEQWDLPAAYASELGGLNYGGHWARSSELPLQRDPDWWAQEGRPVFVRAIVRIPDLRYGPLPRRPRRRLQGLESVLLGADYPVNCRLQGVWCWQELETAVRHGARILRILETWVHLGGGHPFQPWWETIQQGRRMPGLAGVLAKSTGNALWGRFCMDSTVGVRTIRGTNGKLGQRALPFRGGLPPAHDLAETVSGRIRARLYDRMMEESDRLVSAHTDGLWIMDGTARRRVAAAEWRLKQRARRLDLLDPQVLRYWPRPARPTEPWVVFAGVPPLEASAAFEREWAEKGWPE